MRGPKEVGAVAGGVRVDAAVSAARAAASCFCTTTFVLLPQAALFEMRTWH
jgi:hypothetical protein